MNDEVSEFMVAGIVGLLGWFFGGLDGYIKVLIACTAIDYITGICRAGLEGKISSKIAFSGIARKITMFMLVGVANIVDVHLLDSKQAFRIAIILFYIGNEGISIIENADKLGVPIPKFLRGRFLEFSKKNQQEVEEQTAT
ncbi:MAG: phage holin family protein [Synergistaceae bacterium]|nr:phage holin family protein [Synergistaceae bacterium]